MDHPALAYFITFRTYGTWLHGDLRGSVDRHRHIYGTAMLPPIPGLESAERARLRGEPVVLDAARRTIVAQTIRDVCRHRGWVLHALAVRTEHVHVVLTVASSTSPEQAMNALKSWASRRLVERGALASGARAWSRHGSTRYLFASAEIDGACRYVLEGQGAALEGAETG